MPGWFLLRKAGTKDYLHNENNMYKKKPFHQWLFFMVLRDRNELYTKGRVLHSTCCVKSLKSPYLMLRSNRGLLFRNSVMM